MTRSTFGWLPLAAAFLAFSFALSAQDVRIVKQVGMENPTLLYRGVQGDAALSRQIGTYLDLCDWFAISRSGSADYEISGMASGGRATLNVKTPGGTSFNAAMPAGDQKRAAAKLVDGILKKIFDVPGLCDTKIAFVSPIGGVKQIFVCDFDGKNIRQITSGKYMRTEPDWGLRNNLLIYTAFSRTYSDVQGYNFSTNQAYTLANYPGMNGQGAVSPNGQFMALILSRDRKVELYVKYLSNNGARRLTKGESAEASPCWSPDGSKICFVSQTFNTPKLKVMALNGRGVASVAGVGSDNVSPDWSSDNKIVYSAKLGGQYTLAVTDMKNGAVNKVPINAGGDWESPSWAPDNRHVVCSHREGYQSRLYLIDTWTGKARAFPLAVTASLPSWSALY